MATVTETRSAAKTTAAPYWDPNQLPFGTRVTLLEAPGVHRVVREAAMGNDGHFRVRVREVAGNRSLVGPVRSVRPRDVAAIVTDGPEAGPAEVNRENVAVEPPAVAAETLAPADTYTPAWFAASRAVARGDACWMPAASLIEAICQHDAIRHELTRMGADVDGAALDARAAFDDAREAEALAAEHARDIVPACCSDLEPDPCRACVAFDGPADLSDAAWDDTATWGLGPDDGLDRWTITEADDEPGPRTLEEQVLDHARELRAQGSPLGDLLAERAEALAAEIRHLDASTVEQYRDRREAALFAAPADADAWRDDCGQDSYESAW